MGVNFKISQCFYIAFALVFIINFSGCEDKDESVKFYGYLEGEYRYISAQTSGKIVNLSVKEAQRVQKGDALFKIEDTAQIANLAAAKQNLSSLKAQLDDLNLSQRDDEIKVVKAKLDQARSSFWIADKNYKRAKELLIKKAISDKDAQNLKAEYDRAKALVSELEASLNVANLPARKDQIKSKLAQVKAAKAQVDLARFNLDQTAINAPISGLVEKIFFNEGEFASPAAPVLSLLLPDELRAIFYVPTEILPLIKEGQSVNISCQNCPQISAKIAKIASEPEYTPPIIYSQNSQDTLTYRVEAKLDSPSEFLHPAQLISVKLR